VFLDGVSTLNNLAPGCFLEKLSLGHYCLSAGPLTNSDLDHRRRSGETRARQVPNTIIDRIRPRGLSRSFMGQLALVFGPFKPLQTNTNFALPQYESTPSLTEERCGNRRVQRLS